MIQFALSYTSWSGPSSGSILAPGGLFMELSNPRFLSTELFL